MDPTSEKYLNVSTRELENGRILSLVLYLSKRFLLNLYLLRLPHLILTRKLQVRYIFGFIFQVRKQA